MPPPPPSPPLWVTPSAMQVQYRQLDFISVKHACPKGLYIAPVPTEPCRYEGVLFVRQGLFGPAILRFHLAFPINFPDRPPSITFTSDIFHPLVTPLTTYTHTMQDRGADYVTATDEERLPPGGFSLSHAFHHWFDPRTGKHSRPALPHTQAQNSILCAVEVLYYLRNAFRSASLLDAIPLEAAANPGAWHAWKSFRAKSVAPASSNTSKAGNVVDMSIATRQQPGGARMPGEWNWEGVWEDRVAKGIRASISEQAIFGQTGHSDDLIAFLNMDTEAARQAMGW